MRAAPSVNGSNSSAAAAPSALSSLVSHVEPVRGTLRIARLAQGALGSASHCGGARGQLLLLVEHGPARSRLTTTSTMRTGVARSMSSTKRTGLIFRDAAAVCATVATGTRKLT